MSLDPSADYLSLWLRAMPGCRFATSFAKEGGRVGFWEETIIDENTPANLSAHFDGCASDEHAAVAVFPHIKTEADIAGLLCVLARDERWDCSASLRPPRDGLFIVLKWKTQGGPWSRTLGLAPVMSMPLTRRAPYVAIALWPGKTRISKDGHVGLIDMPSKLGDVAKHKLWLKESEDRARELLQEEPSQAPWREVAFCLPASVEGLLPLPHSFERRF